MKTLIPCLLLLSCDAGTHTSQAALTESTWCKHVTAGPGGDPDRVLVDFSGANALVRFFGVEAEEALVDGAVVAAFAAPAPPNMEAYVSALTTACLLPATEDRLGETTVTMEGEIAVIAPGFTPAALPAGANAVAIDLRNTPDDRDLAFFLQDAISLALAAPVALPDTRSRTLQGMPSTWPGGDIIFPQRISEIPEISLLPPAGHELPLAFIVGERLPPRAAAYVAALRMQNRAVIVGESVYGAVAEAALAPVGAYNLAFTAREVSLNGQRLPDVIAADYPALTPWEAPQALASTAVTRPRLVASPPRSTVREPSANPVADTSAALLIAHGALRLFFPYFDIVGDTIDERLLETLQSVTPAREALLRLGEAIHDGHCFVSSATRDAAGSAPFYLTELGGEPVVTISLTEQLRAGDTLINIDGVPANAWYAAQYPHTTGATAGYKFDLATRELLRLRAPLVLEVRSAAGVARTETIDPVTLSQEQRIQLGFAGRPRSGWLSDLGADDVYYVNLHTDAEMPDDTWASARFLVLDMRGYPGPAAFDIVPRLFKTPVRGIQFRTSLLVSTDNLHGAYQETGETWGGGAGYDGRVVMLVDHTSVSAAETVAMHFVQSGIGKVVGRQSAGTNGDITQTRLPGGFSFTFTGMGVTFHDGRPFHGSGITPDLIVEPTPLDLSEGVDRQLLAAIALLHSTPE